MARSLRKGLYVDQKLLKKMEKGGKAEPIKTWARSSSISPEMIGFTFLVHNGKEFISVKINEAMVGHKLGEFSPSTKFFRHGGKMQKQLEKKGAPKPIVKK